MQGCAQTRRRSSPSISTTGPAARSTARSAQLAEYYPTRTERAIFEHYRREIAAAIGRGKQFVDLGAGDCGKAAEWLPYLAPSRYVAVDIAPQELADALTHLAAECPDIEVTGIVADFTHGLDLAAELSDDAVTFFYPGSSIGNFAPSDALALLRAMHRHGAERPGSGLLIGVDTRKDVSRMVAAYDDACGVTAAFNRNVLRHVNRVASCDFEPRRFAHVAFFNDTHSRIEMHLEARETHVVRIDGTPRRFSAGERIHTENSYKYSPPEFEALLRQAGWRHMQRWQDEHDDFAVWYATA